ncbi:hypothetical protein Niako_6118 [Niastella koreensis GR20-10]|uniref:Uncharacterized protein n=1 Tax=Niastella koreensis (strain DSM 17620 / KACC 11465 / NBRC 106392 / GR20-10) TaxID=700598 RepID=G8T8Y6_NIAKG|nr:hypothetical protein [Niastella koreensis]AEW02343.1 hypothetical protein Niako_6118 [Niastella koreensis GR20-10]
MSLNKPDRQTIIKAAKENDAKIKFSDSLGRVQVGGSGGSVYTDRTSAVNAINGSKKK